MAKTLTAIIVTKRAEDFHAHVEGNKALWDCGKTENEAIGALVRTHGDQLGLVVFWNEKPETVTVTRS